MHTMTNDESRIWTIIANFAPGRAQAISVRELSDCTGLSDRMVRRIVKALIERHGCPIASSPHPPAGYFIPTERDEIVQTLDSLRGRAVSILTRMSRLRRVTLQETVNQLRLELEHTPAG